MRGTERRASTLLAVKTLKPKSVKGKQKRKKQKQTVRGALVQICVTFLAVLLLCFMWPFNLESVELPEVDSGFHKSAAQSNLLNLYTAAEQMESEQVHEVVSAEEYLDAYMVVPEYVAANVKNESGFQYSVGTPTKEYTEYAFVCNLPELQRRPYQAVIDFEQSLGVTGHKDVEEYIKMGSIVESSMMAGWLNHPVLSGAVGDGVLNRGYVSSGDYMNCNTGGTYAWQNFSAGRSGAYVDAMLVPGDKYDAYVAGEKVDITYVQVKINDFKAHSAPWGLKQTYIHFLDSEDMICGTSGSSGGDIVSSKVPIVLNDDLSTLTSLWSKLSSSSKTYWFPTLEMSDEMRAEKMQVSSGYRFYAGTGNIIELAKGPTTTKLMEQFGDYYLVGVLVYADNGGAT